MESEDRGVLEFLSKIKTLSKTLRLSRISYISKMMTATGSTPIIRVRIPSLIKYGN